MHTPGGTDCQAHRDRLDSSWQQMTVWDLLTNHNHRTNCNLLADHHSHRQCPLFLHDGHLLDIHHRQNHLTHPFHGSSPQITRDLGQHSSPIWSRNLRTLAVTPMISLGSSPNVTCTSQFLTSISDTTPIKSFSVHRASARMPRYGGSYAHENWEGRPTGTRSTLLTSSLWKKSGDNSGRTPMPKSSSHSGKSSARAISPMEICSSSNLNHLHSKQGFSAST